MKFGKDVGNAAQEVRLLYQSLQHPPLFTFHVQPQNDHGLRLIDEHETQDLVQVVRTTPHDARPHWKRLVLDMHISKVKPKSCLSPLVRSISPERARLVCDGSQWKHWRGRLERSDAEAAWLPERLHDDCAAVHESRTGRSFPWRTRQRLRPGWRLHRGRGAHSRAARARLARSVADLADWAAMPHRCDPLQLPWTAGAAAATPPATLRPRGRPASSAVPTPSARSPHAAFYLQPVPLS
eukprot:scaffold86523_cov31-Tisochrysis_lutea.AAC.1